jgi:hypothetical protein
VNKKQIYYHISHVLALNIKHETAADIFNALPNKRDDWQKWVQMGSKHLVLQSLYLSLKSNKLLTHLPDDLRGDLEYIHQLNIERNRSISNQAIDIKNQLKGNGIECMFMKGTGNIFDNLYSDIGERMIYDIDILVEEGMMMKAAEILISSGYYTQKRFNPKAYPSTMHYPILLREDYVAGVEIHRLPVQYHYLKALNNGSVFESKKLASSDGGFWVMDDTHKIIHNFMHSQLMHNGHFHADVTLRNLYDLLLLSQREDLVKVFNQFNHYRGQSSAYLNLMYDVFGLVKPNSLKKSLKTRFFLYRHNLTLTLSRRNLAIYHFLITAFIKYVALPIRTLFDKNARNYVFSRLGNRHWYRDHINAYRRK